MPFGQSQKAASLRRYDPDQVMRVHSSQPRRAPLACFMYIVISSAQQAAQDHHISKRFNCQETLPDSSGEE